MKQRPVHYCYQLLSILLLISLLVSQFAAVYSAPIEAESKQYTTQTISDTVGLLFRTKVTLRQPTDFARLEEMEVVILENGEDWALILVTAQQLEDLARLRFDPRETNELESLALAHEANQPWLAKSMETTFAAVAEFESQQSLNSLDSSSTNTNEHELVAILASTTVEQQAALTILTSIDDDGDGLTNTQEGWWCTNQLNPDSDGDGVNDGDEVQAAKDWLANLTPSYPASGKPFAGWPDSIPNCQDDDKDSIPDLAEIWDLGLNPNRESTDRDKFDDGQELFGITHCTGEGGYCSYGPLPRNEDWGVFFAEMPSFVKSPGNHPFVAAFPNPEIEIVQSSIHVETVTTITTDHVISTGTEETYTTSKTEGISSSTAESQTWNSWQELSNTTASSSFHTNTIQSGNSEFDLYNTMESILELHSDSCNSMAEYPLAYTVGCMGRDVFELSYDFSEQYIAPKVVPTINRYMDIYAPKIVDQLDNAVDNILNICNYTGTN